MKNRIHERGVLWCGRSGIGLGNDMLEFLTVSVIFYFQTKQANIAKWSRVVTVIFYNFNKKF